MVVASLNFKVWSDRCYYLGGPSSSNGTAFENLLPPLSKRFEPPPPPPVKSEHVFENLPPLKCVWGGGVQVVARVRSNLEVGFKGLSSSNLSEPLSVLVVRSSSNLSEPL